MRFIAAVLFLLTASHAMATCREGAVELRGDWGTARFNVDVADTPAERSQGLMFVEEMPQSTGMLFVYEEPQRASFWMKNTLIPLDMLFADSVGRIIHIHHNAIPGDLTGIEGGNNIFAVLEINGGLARRLGVTPGSAMRHPAFNGRSPLWPC